jgi:hypothetical protein
MIGVFSKISLWSYYMITCTFHAFSTSILWPCHFKTHFLIHLHYCPPCCFLAIQIISTSSNSVYHGMFVHSVLLPDSGSFVVLWVGEWIRYILNSSIGFYNSRNNIAKKQWSFLFYFLRMAFASALYFRY